MVKINSGGSPGSGMGARPQVPKEPREVEDYIRTDKNEEAIPKPPPPMPATYSPQAAAFKAAAQAGTPFCEACAGG
jgi:type VI secretion system secreted protein VgrG